MILVTGDCHSDFKRFTNQVFPEQKTLTKEDYVIICGDFGGVWEYKGESAMEKFNLNWLEERNFTTLFVDGNHENFNRLNSYPVETWKGGKVHKIRPSVIHLMRGQIFEIDGEKIFTFGGAQSHDISGGILDSDDPDFDQKCKELNKGWRPYRIRNVSWWEQELASEEEMVEGLANLARYDFEVDYIISHCCSSKTQKIIEKHGLFSQDKQTEFFNLIQEKCSFKKWYFGHYHDNRNVTDKEILLYKQIINLDEEAIQNRAGFPRYMKGDLIKFYSKRGDSKSKLLEGRIYEVHKYGAAGQSEEPSYDICVIDRTQTKTIFEHVRESDICFE